MEKVCYIVITALVASFIILLLKKWGVTEWMQIHGDPISSRLFDCDFCMSFWVAVLLLDEGWQRKDSIDWEPYKELFPEPEEPVTEES